MPRIYRKRTDIPIPEPRHRVGPKGVSSGISFRKLPSPSLDEIKKVCEHYQIKCTGTYKSLASRYLYQMANEIELLVDALKDSGFAGNEPEDCFAILGDIDGLLSKKLGVRSQEKRNVSFGPRKISGTRPATAHPNRGKQWPGYMMADELSANPSSSTNFKPVSPSRQRSNADSEYMHGISSSSRRNNEPLAFLDLERNHEKMLRWLQEDSRRPRSSMESLAHLNLEGQNEEVLRWLKEEIQRSQSLIDRSRCLHDAELVNAQNEMKRVKKAAKLLIRAVHKKGKEKAAKSEANAERERLKRLQGQKMIKSLIQSHSSQIDLLKKGLRVDSPDNTRDQVLLHPWEEVQDNRADVSFGFTESSDLTSILDDLAEESYLRSKDVDNS